MNEDFVTYEQAVALKELGFDWGCLKAYDNSRCLYHGGDNDFIYNDDLSTQYASPLKQQVFRWFREKYEVYPTIMTETADDSLYFRFIAEGGPEWLSFSKIYYTYEEAENACIDKLIELAKQQNNG
jgi:hypothetical protein